MTEFLDPARDQYTVQDYSARPKIEGVEIVALRRFNDDGGSMTELGRLEAGKLLVPPGVPVIR